MTKKRMQRAVLTLGLLISAFLLTSFYMAAANVTVSLGNHIFATEYMEIGIDGNIENGAALQFYDKNGKPISLVEPGMTLIGGFTVKNDSTFDVYYRLRFTDTAGELADVLLATITTEDGQTVLCGPCTVAELTDASRFSPKQLGAGQHLALRLKLEFPGGTGNDAQGKTLSCRLTADMTQVRNNDGMVFDLP